MKRPCRNKKKLRAAARWKQRTMGRFWDRVHANERFLTQIYIDMEQAFRRWKP